MRIVDILNRPWAILESKFETMQDIYARHAAGERIDVEGLKAAAGDSNDDVSKYTVRNGVAIIPIEGVISKRMNLFTFFSGGTSTQVLQQQISDAVSDSAVHSIVLLVDSPGGEVDGTQVAAKAIAESTKPVVALINGLGASAAYWLASQADQIFITDQTTWVGSIGVVTAHTDRSKANEMTGRKITEITAGKYKRIASAHAPLSDEGKQSLQDQVDQVYSVFVDAVAAGRGVSVDIVISDMADGRVFIGQQAIDAGLVDDVSDLDAIITQLNADFAGQQQNPGQAARLLKPNRGEIKMFKTFATEAEYNAAMIAEFERGKSSATMSAIEIEKIKTDAAEAERKRIQSIESTPLASAHPKVIEGMKFDGKSTSADAAMAILSAEEKVRGEKAKEIAEDAGKGVAASGADAGKEAEQAREREKEKVSVDEPDPVKHAAKIREHIAAEEKKGRKLSVAQASAELSNK